MTDDPPSDHHIGLSNPYVRTIAFGRMAGMAGLQIIIVAVGWQLYERTSSALALGLVGLIELIPALLLVIPAGNIVDANPRKIVAMIGHGIMATAAIGLTIASETNAANVWIYAMIALVGVARVTAGPAVGTILPQLLKPSQFARANAWVSSGSQLAAVGGPAIGGVLIALTGTATTAYVVAGSLQLVFIAMLTTLPRIDPPPRDRRRSAADVFAGLKFVRRTPTFLAAITLDLFAVLLGGAVALLPIYARDILQAGPTGLGLLRTAPAIGGVLASLYLVRWPLKHSVGKILFACVAAFGVTTVIFGLSTSLTLSLITLALMGAADMVSAVIRLSLVQLETPPEMRGRVSAVHSLFTGTSNHLGQFESGITAAWWGTVPAVVVGGLGTLAVVGLWMRWFPDLIKRETLGRR